MSIDKLFQEELFDEILSHIFYQKYINEELDVYYTSKPWYGFFYKKHRYIDIYTGKTLWCSKLSIERKSLVDNISLALCGKWCFEAFIESESIVFLILSWHKNWFILPNSDFTRKGFRCKLLLLISWKIVYPENFDKKEKALLFDLFHDDEAKDNFFVCFLFLICFHSQNYYHKDYDYLHTSFLRLQKIDRNNPYVLAYYSRFISRTIGNIYKIDSIQHRGLSYLLLSLKGIDKSRNTCIYWWVWWIYIYLKDFSKALYFLKVALRKGVDTEVTLLLLARCYIYWKIDIYKGIKILENILDFRKYKTLAVAYMYIWDFSEAKKYILLFIEEILEREKEIRILKHKIHTKRLTSQTSLNDIYIYLSVIGRETSVYVENAMGIEKLCYYNTQEKKDFPMIL